jgi:hypothetical protein
LKVVQDVQKDRPPGFIEKGTSVSWEVKIEAFRCTYKDFEWCTYLKEKCGYTKCPFKVKGSFEMKNSFT